MEAFYKDNLNQDRPSRASVIEGFNLIKKGLSQLYILGVRISPRSADMLCFLLVLSQLKEYLCLPPLYPQVANHGLNADDSLLVTNFPTIKGFAIFSRWFLNSRVATKGLLEKVNDFRSYLLQAYAFLKGGIIHITTLPYTIGATLDSKIAITIETTCQVGASLQSDFSLYLPYGFAHNSIIPHHRKLRQEGGDDNVGEVLRRQPY